MKTEEWALKRNVGKNENDTQKGKQLQSERIKVNIFIEV